MCQEGHGVYDCCKICGKHVKTDGATDETGTYHRNCVNALEEEQVLTAAACFIAYRQILGRSTTMQEVTAEMLKYDNYDSTRIYRIVHETEQHIDDNVQTIFEALIVP